MNRFTLLSMAITALAIGLAGCSKDAPPADVQTFAPDAAGIKAAPGEKVNGATAVSQPTANVPEGGIVLRPSNPNDPRFQADPNLKGGG